MNIYAYHVIMDSGFSSEYTVYAPNSIVAADTLRAMVEVSGEGEMVDYVLESVQ